MPRLQKHALRALVIAIILFLGAKPCLAQLDTYADLDRLGEDLARKLKSEKSHQIAVADLLAGKGAVPSQGHHFAEFLSQSLQRHGKKLKIVKHLKFDEALRIAKIPTQSFTSATATAARASLLLEDILVIGSVDRDETQYAFQITAIRMSDGKTLASGSASFARTEFIDSLSEPFPPKFDFLVLKFASQTGMKNPTCLFCPDPTYNDRGRADKLQGTVVFDTVITQAGYIVALRPVKLIGDGLDEKAFETIKSWKLRPATDAAGNPVAVLIPIEVTFRLF